MRIKLFILGLFLMTGSTVLLGQETYNKWSVGANIGVHDGTMPTTKHTRLYQLHHYGVNGRYMLNNRFGFMADMGYDYFDAFKSGELNVHYWRLSIQAVANAGDVLKFHTFSKRIGLLTHGGLGLSTMFLQKDMRPVIDKDDPYFKGADDMINFIMGITPQFKLTERISINADASFVFHHNQTMMFDFSGKASKEAINGYFFNFTLGASFYLGKNKTHLDWVPTEYTSDISDYEARLKELEDRIKDDDKDGVPNHIDVEPNTPEGSYVDSKGAAIIDTDGDGILDAYDVCPSEKGTLSTDGCPDSDQDGIPDVKDRCPDVKGRFENSGCPEVAKETVAVMDRALKGVRFANNKAVLLVESYPALDEVVKVLKEHPEYNLLVEGHTDDVGSEKSNLTLSENRTNAIGEYLRSKGIEEERLVIRAYGETKPRASNKTKEGRAQNRRVEFRIIF